MSKITREGRSALQSARAKNRKLAIVLGNAAVEHGISVPKNIVAKIAAVEAYFASVLDKAAKAAPEVELVVDTSETHDAAPDYQSVPVVGGPLGVNGLRALIVAE